MVNTHADAQSTPTTAADTNIACQALILEQMGSEFQRLASTYQQMETLRSQMQVQLSGMCKGWPSSPLATSSPKQRSISSPAVLSSGDAAYTFGTSVPLSSLAEPTDSNPAAVCPTNFLLPQTLQSPSAFHTLPTSLPMASTFSNLPSEPISSPQFSMSSYPSVDIEYTATSFNEPFILSADPFDMAAYESNLDGTLTSPYTSGDWSFPSAPSSARSSSIGSFASAWSYDNFATPFSAAEASDYMGGSLNDLDLADSPQGGVMPQEITPLPEFNVKEKQVLENYNCFFEMPTQWQGNSSPHLH